MGGRAGQYKQMFIDKMRMYDDEMSIGNPEPDVASPKDFY